MTRWRSLNSSSWTFSNFEVPRASGALRVKSTGNFFFPMIDEVDTWGNFRHGDDREILVGRQAGPWSWWWATPTQQNISTRTETNFLLVPEKPAPQLFQFPVLFCTDTDTLWVFRFTLFHSVSHWHFSTLTPRGETISTSRNYSFRTKRKDCCKVLFTFVEFEVDFVVDKLFPLNLDEPLSGAISCLFPEVTFGNFFVISH